MQPTALAPTQDAAQIGPGDPDLRVTTSGPRVDAVAEESAGGGPHVRTGTSALLRNADHRPYDEHLCDTAENLAHRIRLDGALERLHQFIHRSASG